MSASTPGGYTVTYTTTGICPNSSNVSVTINAADDATFSYTSSTFCITGSNPLPSITGLAGGSFSGSAGLVINTTTGEIDIASTGVGGPFTITYTTNGTCPNSSNINVNISIAPDATFSYIGTPYCATANATVTFAAGASAGVFSASPAGLSINTITGEVDLTLSTAGTYTVTNTIVASGGCAAAASNTTITINSIVVANPSALIGCDSLSYEGTMYYTSTIVNDTVFAGGFNGCDSITNQQITINTTPEVNLTTLVSCDSLLYNGTMYYVTTVVGDTAFAGAFNGCDSITNQPITINTTPVVNLTILVGCDSLLYNGTMYYVSTVVGDTVFGGAFNGCDSITNQPITINTTVVITPTVLVGCDSLLYDGTMYYTSVMVNDTTFGGAVSGCDSITNQQITINTTPVVTPVALVGCDSLLYDGLMYYSSVMVNDTVFGGAFNGCDSITNQQITINNVIASFTPSILIGQAPLNVDFFNNSTGATSYSWDFGNTLTSTATNPSTVYNSEGSYVVTLIAIEGACRDTLITTIEVEAEKLTVNVPSVFSPNGDGQNDLWILRGIENYPNVKVVVFNRWGGEMYSSTGYAEPWDGTYNGTQSPSTTYYYIIDLGDDIEPFSGTINIIR